MADALQPWNQIPPWKENNDAEEPDLLFDMQDWIPADDQECMTDHDVLEI